MDSVSYVLGHRGQDVLGIPKEVLWPSWDPKQQLCLSLASSPPFCSSDFYSPPLLFLRACVVVY